MGGAEPLLATPLVVCLELPPQPDTNRIANISAEESNRLRCLPRQTMARLRWAIAIWRALLGLLEAELKNRDTPPYGDKLQPHELSDDSASACHRIGHLVVTQSHPTGSLSER